jgi:hypothetical protein
MIDKNKLQKFLPKGSHHTVTDEVITLIENIENDTGMLQENIEESLLTYLPVLVDVKVDLKAYVNAVKYISLTGNMDNNKAWEIVFPEKYNKLVSEGRWNTSHVSMYNKSSLIVKLQAQTLLGFRGLLAPIFFEQIETHRSLANGIAAGDQTCSPTVQQAASAKLLDILAPKDDNKVVHELGLDDATKDITKSLFAQIKKSSELQALRFKAGESIEDIQNIGLSNVVEVEIDG